MQTLKGVLIFSGDWLIRPWNLVQQDGTKIDLYPLIDQMFRKANGKPADQYHGHGSYTFMLDDSAEFKLEYETDTLAILQKRVQKKGGVGMQNIGAYLPEALTWLSGRKVEVEIGDAGLKIVADKSEEIFGVKFFGDGNSGRIPNGAVHTVCKISTSDCCIFLVAGPEGFSCEKFNRMGQYLLKRHAKGTMRASRVGNCALIGREVEQPVTAA